MTIERLIAYLKYKKIPKEIIVKAVFLIEWKYVLVNKKRLFNSFNWVKKNGYFDIKYKKKLNILNKEDNLSFLIDFIEPKNIDYSSFIEMNIFRELIQYIDFILEKYERLKYTGFSNLFVSTYPYIYSEYNQKVNLVKLMEDYSDYKNKYINTQYKVEEVFDYIEKNTIKDWGRKRFGNDKDFLTSLIIYSIMFGTIMISLDFMLFK